jgi:DNA mismatch endonuclease (patch repair protein)
MAAIKSKNTKPEIAVRQFLYSKGIRYRLHRKDLPGKPDLVISKLDTLIFVHGCYWHRHKNCKLTYTPKSNTLFWEEKFEANITRDNKINNQLLDMGWKVIVIWECEVKSGRYKEKLIHLIKE